MEEKNINYTDGTSNSNMSNNQSVPTQSVENLSQTDKNAIERDKVRAEKKAYKEKRKIKRAKKALRCRRGKNFGWFITGFFLSLILLISGILVGVKLIPIKTYLGDKTSEYVDEETVGSKSLVDAITGLSEYSFNDLPVASKVVFDLLSSSGIDNILTFNEEKLKTVKLDGSFGQGLLESVRVSEQLFGDLSNLEMFQNVSVADPDTSASDFQDSAKLYYYQNTDSQGEVIWERAFNDDGSRVAASEGKQLYLHALQEFTINEMQQLFSIRFEMLSVASILETLAGLDENSLFVKVVGDKTVKDMSSFGSNDILLSSVLDLPEKNYSNTTIYNVLRDAVAYDGETGTYDESVTNQTLTLGDLSHINIDGVKLCRVIADNAANKTLYNVLREAVTYDGETGTYAEISNDSIKFGDLKNINILGVKLNTVVNEIDIKDNAVLKILLKDEDVCFGNLAEKIDNIRVSDLYEVECFVKDYANTNDIYARYSYSNGVYTFDPSGEYYVNKNSGVWMLILYNSVTNSTTGYATTYTDKDLRFKNLRGNVGNLSDSFMGATIRQLYVAGVINTTYDNIMNKTVRQVLEALNKALNSLS